MCRDLNWKSCGELLPFFGRAELIVKETNLFEFIKEMPFTIKSMNNMHHQPYQLRDITEFLKRTYDGALGQADLSFTKVDWILRSSNQW